MATTFGVVKLFVENRCVVLRLLFRMVCAFEALKTLYGWKRRQPRGERCLFLGLARSWCEGGGVDIIFCVSELLERMSWLY